MSTPPTRSQLMRKLAPKKRGHKWKKRGYYGNLLLKRVQRMELVFEKIWNEAVVDGDLKLEKLDLKMLMDLGNKMDYTIQTQLSNIHAIEEFEILERTEQLDARNGNRNPIQEAEIQTDRKF